MKDGEGRGEKGMGREEVGGKGGEGGKTRKGRGRTVGEG